MQEIPLSRGLVALVDDADFDWVSQWKWTAVRVKRNWYAYRKEPRPDDSRKNIFLHQEILRLSRPLMVDHADGNGLNNQRENLRPATPTGNSRNARRRLDNSSGYRGVDFYSRHGKWRARIRIGKSRLLAGYFDDAESAARAYDALAVQHHGQFARLNFPSGGTAPVPAATGSNV